MLSVLFQIVAVLVVLAVLGVVFKIVAIPFVLLGFLTHNFLPIALVGGGLWWYFNSRQKRLPGA
jgi:hypothetical protein